jgi:signal transduction histidine kinase
VVRRCVDLHGGSIVIESTEGAGTTVHVTLPLFPLSINEGPSTIPTSPHP